MNGFFYFLTAKGNFRKGLFIIISLFIFLQPAFSQPQRKEVNASRTDKPPVINGDLSDPAWQKAGYAKDFFQHEPHNDRSASFPTTVKILYDDNAIYIGAKMTDPSPDSVLTEMGLRNSGRSLNADLFWIDISPFDDGQNAFTFMVSSSGVQTDINISAGAGRGGFGRRGDSNWDAVWESAVSITDNGWVVEMAIPYSALRFPNREVQEWGVNFWREIRRYRETSSWNFVDRRLDDELSSMGLITGIKGVKPPLRLSFYPYVSGYLENDGVYSGWGNSINGGMDVKYGISESFTMDMTLIPDFGQVQTDEKVLNLSPYEIRYDENRQFFTEGTELFGKADLFYSRRVGSQPTGYNQVRHETDDNEMVVENPIETSMINATKLSGRTSSGLGIGVFNAMTSPSFAVIKDTISGDKRDVRTQPFTNYNMVVFDQSLVNNSFVSLANTNVVGSMEGYTANVTGTEFRIQDRTNMYRVTGTAALSQQYLRNEDNIFGYKYDIRLGKFGGTFQYNYSRSVITDTYDQNDFGFLRRNNQVEDGVSFSHNIFTPFWILNNLSNTISIDYSRLYEPDRFTSLSISYFMMMLFESRYHLILRAGYEPLGRRDYFEPRAQGRFYKTEQSTDIYLRFSSDYRKRLYFNGSLAFGTVNSSDIREVKTGFSFSPTLRVNDKFNVSYGIDYEMQKNNIGYVSHANVDSVFFGKRDLPIITNTFNTTYIFNNDISLDLDLRHYWSRVDYNDSYYLLGSDGVIEPFDQDLAVNDINYNAFTIDMKFTWNFAPGSQLTAVWKNIIDSRGYNIKNNYLDNLNHILGQSQINSFSVKILYYLDYQSIQNRIGLI